MTVTHRKRQVQPAEEIQTLNEPGLQIECDSCRRDLTHSVRIKCADPVCEVGDGVDLCPGCFCEGQEFGKHKRTHAYRVVELHSYPILEEDWGADEELLLLEGISLQGLGNWQAVSEHVGTRTKDEVEKHYNKVYISSQNWPLPRMDLEFDIDPADFQARKRRRISTMNTTAPPAPKVPPTSAPGVHEVATFLPGRLEFEHELDNEAEDLIKDLEFGICLYHNGEMIPEDENETRERARKEEERCNAVDIKTVIPNGVSVNGNGHPPMNGDANKLEDDEENDDAEENMQPLPLETPDSVAFKLAMLEMYCNRVEKRLENKSIMFERGLLEYKKMQAADKKRPKDEKDIIHRLRPFAKLQSAADYEVFCADVLYEALLRKRIQELQTYRRFGLRTAADIEKYESDVIKRAQAKSTVSRDWYSSERLQLRNTGNGRQSSGPDSRRSHTSFGPDSDGRRSTERDSTPKTGSAANGVIALRKPPAPLNLANSPMLHLLTPPEQTLCSQLRILPKPYLVIKETLVREYARRGGKLRRREARDLVKIDVNKTSRVWDFLVQAGFLKIAQDPLAGAQPPAPPSAAGLARPPSMLPSTSFGSMSGGLPSSLFPVSATSSTMSMSGPTPSPRPP